MNWTELDTWIALTAVLLGMACAIPGIFLLLSRQSMFGHGISHAVLPGIVIAFLVTQSRGLPAVMVGAVIAAVITAVLTRLVHRSGRIEEGASLGVIFTTMFALGIVLIRMAADSVHLDPDCLLFGILETAVMDADWASGSVPDVTTRSALLLLLNLLLGGIFLKELRISTFDPEHAAAMGFRPGLVNYGIMICTAVTAVVAFEAVGSILVIALMIGPPATAYLLARRLSGMLVLSLLFGAASALGGVIFSLTVPSFLFGPILPGISIGAVNAAGSISVVTGLLFAMVWIFHTLRTRFQRQRVGAT